MAMRRKSRTQQLYKSASRAVYDKFYVLGPNGNTVSARGLQHSEAKSEPKFMVGVHVIRKKEVRRKPLGIIHEIVSRLRSTPVGAGKASDVADSQLARMREITHELLSKIEAVETD